MLMSLPWLVEKHNLDITGVFHIGAHHGEEAEVYAECGIPHVLWVEADPDTYRVLVEKIGDKDGHQFLCVALDAEPGEVTFHRANNGQSSSLLELGTHLQHHPEVEYVGDIIVKTTTVDTIYEYQDSSLNFWNLDVQGAELRVLQGASESLAYCDYIYAEVNEEEVYVGCALVDDLDAYLSDFERVETAWTTHKWGDALYVRKALL